MVRKEPKLRPSLSWEEMQLAIQALDSCIFKAIESSNVTLETVAMDKLKNYLNTFKPAVVAEIPADLMARLMMTYGGKPKVTEVEPVQESRVIPDSTPAAPPAELTDAQRYSMLKLKNEKNYTEEETKFVLDYGFKLMMEQAQAGKKFPLSEDDL